MAAKPMATAKWTGSALVEELLKAQREDAQLAWRERKDGGALIVEVPLKLTLTKTKLFESVHSVDLHASINGQVNVLVANSGSDPNLSALWDAARGGKATQA